jgi:hypothetical protein
MASVHDENKRRAIIDARADSRGFVAGLYVDLYDFCWQLRSKLSLQNIRDAALLSAAKDVCNAIELSHDNVFVIENQSPHDKNCHGISIYFPYLTDSEKTTMESLGDPLTKDGRDAVNSHGTKGQTNGKMEIWEKGGMDVLVKGGLDALNKGGLDALNKGGLDALNKGGLDALNKLRRQRIEETEQYYSDLELSKKTGWDRFIRHGWSRWLAEDAEAGAKSSSADISNLLDQRYSARQCAINLLSLCRELEKAKNSGYPGGWGTGKPPHEGAGRGDQNH